MHSRRRALCVCNSVCVCSCVMRERERDGKRKISIAQDKAKASDTERRRGGERERGAGGGGASERDLQKTIRRFGFQLPAWCTTPGWRRLDQLGSRGSVRQSWAQPTPDPGLKYHASDHEQPSRTASAPGNAFMHAPSVASTIADLLSGPTRGATNSKSSASAASRSSFRVGPSCCFTCIAMLQNRARISGRTQHIRGSDRVFQCAHTRDTVMVCSACIPCCLLQSMPVLSAPTPRS